MTSRFFISLVEPMQLLLHYIEFWLTAKLPYQLMSLLSIRFPLALLLSHRLKLIVHLRTIQFSKQFQTACLLEMLRRNVFWQFYHIKCEMYFWCPFPATRGSIIAIPESFRGKVLKHSSLLCDTENSQKDRSI